MAAERVVRAFLVARGRGDDAAAAAVCAPDVAWHSPVDGVVTGRDAVRRALAEARRDTRRFSSEVLRIEARGDTVVALVRNRGERGDERLDSRQLLRFTVAGGLVVRVRISVDDPDAVRAFWEDDEPGPIASR